MGDTYGHTRGHTRMGHTMSHTVTQCHTQSHPGPAGVLWLGMVAGELRLLSQPAALGLAYTAAFTLPAAYVRSRCGCLRCCG